MKSLGFGLGLRPDHYDAIWSELPSVGFFEALITLFRSLGPLESQLLERLREGANFGLLCESMALQVGDSAAPQRTASLLRGWLAEEIVLEFASS
jgi:hypothetical protein